MIRLNPSEFEYETLDDVLKSIGAAGARMSAIEACEGAAGNISVLYAWQSDGDARFGDYWEMPAPVECPELEGAWLAVTGSGRRLREVEQAVGANVALVEVLSKGKVLGIHASHNRLFDKPTSELNTHLALHAKHAARGGSVHTVLHAQPLHLTFLSHLSDFRHKSELNARILRWQPELIMLIPDGIGVTPFAVPGSKELLAATVEQSLRHRLVVWSQHGAIARYSGSVKKACDLIEYAETGARYEYMNIQIGGHATGIAQEDLLRICKECGITQTIFPV